MGMKHDLTGFFLDLADSLSVFRGIRNIPFANCNGCRAKLNNKGDAVNFDFLSANGSEVKLVIRLKDLYANPKEYIEGMYELISQGLEEMKNNSQIIALPNKDFTINKIGAR
jgi:hypothetical protein